MTRTIPAGIAADLVAGRITLARCLRLDLRDGTSLGFTTLDSAISVNLGDGALSYSASTGAIPSAVQLALGLASDNFEVRGPITSLVTRAGVLGGRYNRARARLFEVDQTALGDVIGLLSGRVTQAKVEAGSWIFEVRSAADAFNQTIGHVLTPYCKHDFGTYYASGPKRGGCPVVLAPPVWTAAAAKTARPGPFDALGGSVVSPTVFNGFVYECELTGTTGASEPVWPTVAGSVIADGSTSWTARQARTWPATVTAVTDDMRFRVSFPAGAPADDLFNKGVASFLTGDLAGTMPMEVFDFVASTGLVTLYQPLAEPPTIGDTLTLRIGCDNLRETCRDVHRNTLNYGGDPDSPSSDNYLKYQVPGSTA